MFELIKLCKYLPVIELEEERVFTYIAPFLEIYGGDLSVKLTGTISTCSTALTVPITFTSKTGTVSLTTKMSVGICFAFWATAAGAGAESSMSNILIRIRATIIMTAAIRYIIFFIIQIKC
jgi:hypothetical protein